MVKVRPISRKRMSEHVMRSLHDGRGYIRDNERDQYAKQFKDEYRNMSHEERTEADKITQGFLFYWF